MKFAFIEVERQHFELRILCHVLGVSRSGYYRWRRGGSAGRQQYRAEALGRIQEVFTCSGKTYGSPRIQRALRNRGHCHSRRFIGRLMRQAGLRARAAVGRRPNSGPPARLTQITNVLRRRFNDHAPNEVWASDLTYIRTREGWLYLAVVLDLASRRVVGWSMGAQAGPDLTVQALRMAVEQRRPKRGLLHHSDRGIQYSSAAYLSELTTHGLHPSFSRLGNCWDNAVVESFFHTLKVERLRGRPMHATRATARQDLFEYIEVWYNRRRLHSTLGYLSPAEFEDRL